MDSKDFLKIIGIDPTEVYSYCTENDKININYILLNSLKINYEITNCKKYLFKMKKYLVLKETNYNTLLKISKIAPITIFKYIFSLSKNFIFIC